MRGASAEDLTTEEIDEALAGGPFSQHLGLEVIEATATKFLARWVLGRHLHQPVGIVHGGAYSAVVETAGSVAAWLWAKDRGGIVAGVNNNTDFFRAVSEGVLMVEGIPLHQGRSQQVWQVSIRDDAERLVARGTLRLQNLYPAQAE